jgi:hypothetical protein
MRRNERSGELDARNGSHRDRQLWGMRCPRARPQQARNHAILMLRITIAVYADEVRFTATVVALDTEIRRVDLLAVLGARDMPRLCVVNDREQLADNEQRDSECCGSCGSAAHAQTFPQTRLDCT